MECAPVPLFWLSEKDVVVYTDFRALSSNCHDVIISHLRCWHLIFDLPLSWMSPVSISTNIFHSPLLCFPWLVEARLFGNPSESILDFPVQIRTFSRGVRLWCWGSNSRQHHSYHTDWSFSWAWSIHKKVASLRMPRHLVPALNINSQPCVRRLCSNLIIA